MKGLERRLSELEMINDLETICYASMDIFYEGLCSKNSNKYSLMD
jgi:hypothetical protein